MKVELSDIQVKNLVQILVNYYNGQKSVAMEAPVIQELIRSVQLTATETSAPSEVKETETDGAEK